MFVPGWKGYLFGQAAAGPTCDPHWDDVVLLMGFDTFAPIVGFIDESPAAHVPLAIGDCHMDGTTSRFNGQSAAFDGDQDGIQLDVDSDWYLSDANSDEFTIETWARWDGLAGNQIIVGCWDTVHRCWRLRKMATTNNIQFMWSTNDSDSFTVETSGAGITTGVWYFIAVEKDAAGTIRIYVDGVVKGSSTPADSSFFHADARLIVGAENATTQNSLDGWLDELRITKGVARYAGDGAVPTAAFPRTSCLGPLALDFVHGVTSSSQTFAMNFGAAADDRHLILVLSSCYSSGFAQNFNGVSSIGGVVPTLLHSEDGIPDTAAGIVSMWIAAVPAGASGDVVINPAGDHNRFSAAMYRLTGDLQSLTPYDSGGVVGTTGATSFPIGVASGGALVAVAFWIESDAVPALVLSGVSNDYSAVISIIKSSVYGSLVSVAGETVTLDVNHDSHAISILAASLR